MSAAFQLRSALQVGLTSEQIKSVASGQSLRMAAGEPLQAVGPAVHGPGRLVGAEVRVDVAEAVGGHVGEVRDGQLDPSVGLSILQTRQAIAPAVAALAAQTSGERAREALEAAVS